MTQEQRDALLLDVHAAISGINARMDGYNREFREVKKDIAMLEARAQSLEKSRSIGRGAMAVALGLASYLTHNIFEILNIIKETHP
jgi:hypothetical protein